MSSSSSSQYKEAKEAFVSQLQGGSIARINAVSLTALTTYTLWAVLRNRRITFAGDDGRAARRRQAKRRQTSRGYSDNDGDETAQLLRTWAVEIVILVLPIILACTVFASHLTALNAILIAASAYVLARFPAEEAQRGTRVNDVTSTSRKHHWSKQSDDEEEEDEERERLASLDEAAKRQRHLERTRDRLDDASASTGGLLDTPPMEPFRVSVDSAAEAAHAAAAPPTPFVAPGEAFSDQLNGSGASSSSSSRGKTHRASASLARSAEPLPQQHKRTAVDTTYVPHTQPFLTVYRAHMMLMTIICILAVDFRVFPREFAKCETWGTSLMDLGVGSFVFSLGIISALPMLRTPSQRFKPMRLQLLRDARRSVPLFVLGGVRVLMVKGVEYPEHVSEYGVHWNFFFTLAVLPFCGTLSRPIARTARFATVGLLLTGAHQAALSLTDLGSWASSNAVARTTLLTQNKEGLTSLPGYLAIFLLGLDLGFYILPRDPYLAYRRPTASRQREKTDKLAMVLVSYSIIWWGAYYAQALLTGGQVSRRLANLPYVLWISAYNTSFLLAYVLIYLVLLQPLDDSALQRRSEADPVEGSNTSTATQRQRSDDDDDETRNLTTTSTSSNSKKPVMLRFDAKTPLLLDALNANAFAVFLLANLLTGAVNVTMQTMYASDATALVVLLTYVSLCSALASLAYAKGWRLKV